MTDTQSLPTPSPFSPILLVLLLGSGLSLNAAAQDTLYVDADATGATDGTSWTDAFTSLQDALVSATRGDEVWVAEGTYFPDDGMGHTPGDRTATFSLVPGVTLYGGFQGTETRRDERDRAAYPTVLSGDLAENDTDNVALDEPTRSENSYHVVTAGSAVDSTTVLDGFTITGGHASETNDIGGGMLFQGCGAIVRYVNVVANTARKGGGGMSMFGSEILLSNVVFEHNVTEGIGGGIQASFASNLTITQAIFRGNRAASGGAIRFNGFHMIISYSVFVGNTASGSGGGIFNNNGEQTIANVLFLGNEGSEGGGMLNDESTATLTNVLFSGNTAREGGGLYTNLNEDDDLLVATNVTFSGNTASNRGGGLYNVIGDPSPVFTNSIFWGNTAAEEGAQLYNDARFSAQSLLSNSFVEGGLPPGTMDGGGNLDADPLFVDALGTDGMAGTDDDDLRLLAGSPAIDTGDNSVLPADTLDLDADGDTTEVLPVDLAGNVRIWDGGSGSAVVDRGAYEFDAPPVRVAIEPPAEELPEQAIMLTVYPNPFRSAATVRFTVRRSLPVELALYDMTGRKVRLLYRGRPQVGQMHEISMDGEGLPSGSYLLRLSGADLEATRGIVLIR